MSAAAAGWKEGCGGGRRAVSGGLGSRMSGRHCTVPYPILGRVLSHRSIRRVVTRRSYPPTHANSSRRRDQRWPPQHMKDEGSSAAMVAKKRCQSGPPQTETSPQLSHSSLSHLATPSRAVAPLRASLIRRIGAFGVSLVPIWTWRRYGASSFTSCSQCRDMYEAAA